MHKTEWPTMDTSVITHVCNGQICYETCIHTQCNALNLTYNITSYTFLLWQNQQWMTFFLSSLYIDLIYQNSWWKTPVHWSYISLHNLSILALWTDLPVMKLPLPGPRRSSIILATSEFSIPLSDLLTRQSTIFSSVMKNYWKTVITIPEASMQALPNQISSRPGQV